jgi:hypothetical protein
MGPLLYDVLAFVGLTAIALLGFALVLGLALVGASPYGLAAIFAGLVVFALALWTYVLGRRIPHFYRGRLSSNRTGKAGWSDLWAILGAVFLVVAVGVFALLALAPTSYSSTATNNPWVLAIGGGIGILLIVLGLVHRRMGGR